MHLLILDIIYFCFEIHYFVGFVGKKLFHNIPFSKRKKGFKNSKFKINESVCNQFQRPYRPFIPTNHAPTAENIHKRQHSLNHYDLYSQLENKQQTDLACHGNIQNLDWKNINPLPMKQDSFHISNHQYSEVGNTFFLGYIIILFSCI